MAPGVNGTTKMLLFEIFCTISHEKRKIFFCILEKRKLKGENFSFSFALLEFPCAFGCAFVSLPILRYPVVSLGSAKSPALLRPKCCCLEKRHCANASNYTTHTRRPRVKRCTCIYTVPLYRRRTTMTASPLSVDCQKCLSSRTNQVV